MEKSFLLKFKGNKTELHEKLKEWCKEFDRSMNGTIISLISSHLKKYASEPKVKSAPSIKNSPKKR